MDTDVTMFVVGGMFAAIFFAAITILIAALSRFDARAPDSKHLAAVDVDQSDFEHMSRAVEQALFEFSLKHITQAEFDHVRAEASAH